MLLIPTQLPVFGRVDDAAESGLLANDSATSQEAEWATEWEPQPIVGDGEIGSLFTSADLCSRQRWRKP